MHDLPAIGGLMLHLQSQLWIIAKNEIQSFLKLVGCFLTIYKLN